jgi:hypothetical protein
MSSGLSNELGIRTQPLGASLTALHRTIHEVRCPLEVGVPLTEVRSAFRELGVVPNQDLELFGFARRLSSASAGLQEHELFPWAASRTRCQPSALTVGSAPVSGGSSTS